MTERRSPIADLRQRILAGIRAEAELPTALASTGDHDLNPADAAAREARRLREAAVLVPLVLRRELQVLLTRRTEHLNHHAGQICFPGGRVELSDGHPVETALRETEEEIGLSRARVEIAGYLDPYETGTGFHVTPVVGFVAPGFELTLDRHEVAEVFEVPLSFLFDPANHQRHSRMHNGAPRQYFAMPYGDYYIWGATAGMLMNLYRRVHGLI